MVTKDALMLLVAGGAIELRCWPFVADSDSGGVCPLADNISARCARAVSGLERWRVHRRVWRCHE